MRHRIEPVNFSGQYDHLGKFIIYGYADPLDNKLVYIDKSTNDINNRINCQLADANNRTNSTRLSQWLRYISKRDEAQHRIPIVRILSVAPNIEELEQHKQKWVRIYNPILNSGYVKPKSNKLDIEPESSSKHGVDNCRPTLREKFVIYGLYDPVTHKLRYVGQTHTGIFTRLTNHISNANSDGTPVQTWIYGLLNKNLKPYGKIIESVPSSCKNIRNMLNGLESKYIAMARAKDPTLLNVQSGGNYRYKRKKVPAWLVALRFMP